MITLFKRALISFEAEEIVGKLLQTVNKRFPWITMFRYQHDYAANTLDVNLGSLKSILFWQADCLALAILEELCCVHSNPLKKLYHNIYFKGRAVNPPEPVVILVLGKRELCEDVSQVAVGLDAVCLRRFNQAVQRCTRVRSPRRAAEEPVLSVMLSSA